MSSMLYLVGRWAVRARVAVVLAWVILLALLGVLTLFFGGRLDNSVEIPGTESGDALERLAATFPQVSGASAQIAVVGEPGSVVDEGKTGAAINAATTRLAAMPDVEQVTTLGDEFAPTPVSDDGTTALVMIQLDAGQVNVSDETKDSLRDATKMLNEELPDGTHAYLGGALFAQEFPEISITEALGVVVALVVLIFTLGTFIAAGLPLVTALSGVGASMGVLFLMAKVVNINATTPLLAVMLGLAVGIDYSLFIVSRHREQLKAGVLPAESIARALGTAGSAVVFAGLTVMIALLGLGVAGIPFLTLMGVVGSMAVGVAVVAALTFLPAILGFAGFRVLTKKERARLADLVLSDHHGGEDPEIELPAPNRFFQFWVSGATRHPAITTFVVVILLGALSIPATGLRLALPDAGVLPLGNDARTNYDIVAEKFGEGFNGPLIVTTSIVTSTDPLGLMDDLKREIETLPGVQDVPLATPNYTADTGIIQVVPTGAPDSEATEQLVHDIRGMHDRLLEEYGVDIAVTGYTAVGIDVSAKLAGALLPFAVVVVGLSLVLLAVVFRSVAVPVTAALGYLLTVGSTFGLTMIVFKWGFFADAIGVTRLGPIINFMPIVTMGILFGLSMDYEVFLVSRMREDYIHTGRARESVISGFLGSAKVVTAAAIIMVAVFAAFVPDGDMSLKPIAFGLAVGVAIDAFIVRMTLIPAVMVWLGKKAWWLPAWLDKALPTIDIEGEGVLRQRSFENWPGNDFSIGAKGLLVGDTHSPVSFLLPTGKSLIITGDSERVKPLLRAIAGRQIPTEGTLKVLGLLVPERSGTVRRKVAYVAATSMMDTQAEQIRRGIRRAVRENAEMLVIDLGTEDVRTMPNLASVKMPTIVGISGTRPGLARTFASRGWMTIELDVDTVVDNQLQEVQA